MAGRAAKAGVHRRPAPPVGGGPPAGEEELFGPEDLALVSRLVPQVEGLVGDHFRLTSFGPALGCYEVTTLEGAPPDGRAPFALAKLCRYDRRERPIKMGQGISRFYRVFLQDAPLLARARSEPTLSLRSILLYVLTHELVHVVRFESYAVHYGAEGPARDREEAVVHALSGAVLGRLKDREVDRAVRTLAHSGVDVLE